MLRVKLRSAMVLVCALICLIVIVHIRNSLPSSVVFKEKFKTRRQSDEPGGPEAQNAHRGMEGTPLDKNSAFIPDVSVCTLRTTTYLHNKPISLNLQPFAGYARDMKCILNNAAAIFGSSFAVFSNVILDSSKAQGPMKGGERIEDVWNQPESSEYLSLLPGYFNIPCLSPPSPKFDPKDHLSLWSKAIGCYGNNTTRVNELKNASLISGLTIAIQRYEYANLYHTMSDFYNAFVLKLFLVTRSEKVNILFIDAHPAGSLDTVWSTLFGSVYRAGRLDNTVKLEKLAWGMLGYYSPLSSLRSKIKPPYLEEFREFVLQKYDLNATKTIDCQNLNVVIIWRRDYVAHPRNKKGKVARKFSNEDEILATVKATLGSSATVEGTQLDQLDMGQQLTRISKADILMGMHGAGLTHAVFLPATSALIELLPAYSQPLFHFERIASWRSLVYTRWHNLNQTLDKDRSETRFQPDVIRDLVQKTRNKLCK